MHTYVPIYNGHSNIRNVKDSRNFKCDVRLIIDPIRPGVIPREEESDYKHIITSYCLRILTLPIYNGLQ